MTEFPHPYVAVDVVLLTVLDGAVRVLLVERDSPGVAGWGLPGAYLQYDERIDDARDRLLADKCGVSGISPTSYRPLTPRDEPDRDPRVRTISLVSWAPVPASAVRDLAPGAALAKLKPRKSGVAVHLGSRRLDLAVDHDGMVADAATALARQVDHLSPADGAVPSLLPPTFTARDVESVLTLVGAIAQREAPDTNALRRRLLKLTIGTGESEKLEPGQRHRPAELRRWR